ncbi:MAG TPA: glycosyltransferase [Acidimicrobiales bacterium]|nr:glycosyltransferase [Acidimicrobiales bacterium]
MRVLAVLSSLMGGGAERQMTLMLRHLDRERFDPTLCLLSGAEADYLPDLPPGLRVVDLGKRSAGDVAKITWRLSRLVASGRYDLLVSRVDYTNLVSVAATRLARRAVPVVCVEDSVQSRELAGRKDRHLRAALVRATYRRATVVVTPTPGVRSEVLESVPRSSTSVVVISNMVDVAEVRRAGEEPASHPFLTGGLPLVVAAGRLDRAKGFDVLLEALARVNERRACQLALLGKGPELGSLRQLASRLGISGRVHFAGFVGNPFAWMARADLVVCSSRWESFGNVLVEAMALGKAIVSTAAPYGPALLVDDGRNGLVAPVDDPARLAELIETALDDPVLAARLGDEGRRRAEAFDAPVVTRRFEAVFEEAVRETRS